MTINDRVLQIIKSRKGLTQKAMGEAIGVSPSTINNWMRYGRPIPSQYIVPISEYLCVSPLYLLTGKEEDRNLSDDDSEWLALIHNLPDDIKPVIKNMIEGYMESTK